VIASAPAAMVPTRVLDKVFMAFILQVAWTGLSGLKDGLPIRWWREAELAC
jgi:hypothetical protein